jgi:hypothetical protein
MTRRRSLYRGPRAPTADPRLSVELDVPAERFLSYPGCESDDDKQPLYGWAGSNHLQQVQALPALPPGSVDS